VVIFSLSDFNIVKSDSPCESAQVVDNDVIFLEVLQDVLSVNVVFDKDLFLLDSGVVAFVRYWSGVVVCVESGVIHV